MKKLKVGILTVICALAMVMPAMAASNVSQYYGPMNTYIKGELKVSSELCGGRPVAKKLDISTTTGRTVAQISVKYEIQNINGDVAGVYESTGSSKGYNTSKHNFSWSTGVTGNVNTDPYTAFVTHEMKDAGKSHAIYTAIGM